VALVGHNGSGKTTLLRTIAGILPPTSGKITVNGKLSCLIDPGAGIDFEGTGIENIYLLAYTAGHRKSAIEKNIDDIIDFADLGNFINLPIRTYSAGMIARLAFSVATSFEYDIVIMDEGIAAGDAGFLERASSRINDLYSKAGCVVLATHAFDFAKQHCTRIVKMQQGKIIEDTKN
jgi:lipopolysaccharide transport system ATP-binding protein